MTLESRVLVCCFTISVLLERERRVNPVDAIIKGIYVCCYKVTNDVVSVVLFAGISLTSEYFEIFKNLTKTLKKIFFFCFNLFSNIRKKLPSVYEVLYLNFGLAEYVCPKIEGIFTLL